MQDLICKRLAYWSTVIPLPALAVSLIVGAVRIGLELEFLRLLMTALLVTSASSYMASLLLTIVCGVVSKSRPLLILPATSLLLIALFVVFLPENVRENPWRVVDIFIFVGLVVLNIMQMLSLRRRSLALTGRDSFGIR